MRHNLLDLFVTLPSVLPSLVDMYKHLGNDNVVVGKGTMIIQQDTVFTTIEVEEIRHSLHRMERILKSRKETDIKVSFHTAGGGGFTLVLNEKELAMHLNHSGLKVDAIPVGKFKSEREILSDLFLNQLVRIMYTIEEL